MRPKFALWAFDAFVFLFLIWINAPLAYWIATFVALTAIDWIADRWILTGKRVEPTRLFPNRRLVTGMIGALIGAAVGVGIGLFMQSDATTLKWLAILLGSLGFVFGLVFKLTL